VRKAGRHSPDRSQTIDCRKRFLHCSKLRLVLYGNDQSRYAARLSNELVKLYKRLLSSLALPFPLFVGRSQASKFGGENSTVLSTAETLLDRRSDLIAKNGKYAPADGFICGESPKFLQQHD
jgi:hypothetical protein